MVDAGRSDNYPTPSGGFAVNYTGCEAEQYEQSNYGNNTPFLFYFSWKLTFSQTGQYFAINYYTLVKYEIVSL